MNIALAIILEKNKVLIGKIRPEKVNEYGGLEYVFPCESIQDINNIENELINEIKKQTSLDITIIHKIGERVHPSTQNHTYYFHCGKNAGQDVVIAKNIDVESFIWVGVDDLTNYMPTLFNELKDYLEKVR